MIRSRDFAKFILAFLPLIILLSFSCARQLQLPQYPEFVVARGRALPPSLVEIYGRYSATSSGKTVRSGFNLLVDPGKAGYLEILNPSNQLQNAVSLDDRQMTVLWAAEGKYLQEEASPQTLQAVLGLPILPDDLLLLICGLGIDFAKWEAAGELKDGWILKRPPFEARLSMKDHISGIRVRHPGNPEARIHYGGYRMIDNRLIPQKIRLEVPDRRLALELKVEKYLLRDEPGDSTLFAVQLPSHAYRVSLQELYRGKPLLLDQ